MVMSRREMLDNQLVKCKELVGFASLRSARPTSLHEKTKAPDDLMEAGGLGGTPHSAPVGQLRSSGGNRLPA